MWACFRAPSCMHLSAPLTRSVVDKQKTGVQNFALILHNNSAGAKRMNSALNVN